MNGVRIAAHPSMTLAYTALQGTYLSPDRGIFLGPT